jgi:hypothetical protein
VDLARVAAPFLDIYVSFFHALCAHLAKSEIFDRCKYITLFFSFLRTWLQGTLSNISSNSTGNISFPLVAGQP